MQKLLLSEIENAKKKLEGKIVKTPILPLEGSKIKSNLPFESKTFIKLELYQHTGSFKARGNLLAVDKLTDEQKIRGVVAVSAGNHALAVSWAAKQVGTHAKLFMPKTADPFRVEGCRNLGAEVILLSDVKLCFEKLLESSEKEKRTILHPFDSKNMALGSATLGLEISDSINDLDIAILPVGGGGLIAGAATALKLKNPKLKIFGIEPLGADSMKRSFEEGRPVNLDKVNTIADSLGAPMAMKYSYELTRKSVDKIFTVSDEDLKNAMRFIQTYLNLWVEPACAASMAGLMGPVKEYCEGKNVAIIACGSNISFKKFSEILD